MRRRIASTSLCSPAFSCRTAIPAGGAGSAPVTRDSPHASPCRAVPDRASGTGAAAAKEHIDVLVFAGLFLPDGHPEVAKVLISKAEQGTAIRLALGDPDSEAVRLRGQEEHIGEGMAARVRLSLAYLDEAIRAPGVELRLHTTTLYNSIYRLDGNMLVNTHAYGFPAAQSPVLHLRRLAGGSLFDHYQASFERVWAQARPAAALAGTGSADGAR